MPFLTVEEARKYLAERRGRPVPRRTIYNWMDSGKLRFYADPATGRRMLDEDDLKAISEFTVVQVQPATPKTRAKPKKR
jgi:excisionase family DNA binding protein